MIFVQEILEGIDNLRNLCIDSETEACPGLCPNDKCAVQILFNKLLKHGRWIDTEPAPWGQVYETCSECGTRQTLDKGNDNFCGVCGARMDGGEDGNTD